MDLIQIYIYIYIYIYTYIYIYIYIYIYMFIPWLLTLVPLYYWRGVAVSSSGHLDHPVFACWPLDVRSDRMYQADCGFRYELRPFPRASDS